LSLNVYDDFDQPGYSLSDYSRRWLTPYGLGEMAANDTRRFGDGCLRLGAVPFTTASDVDTRDHLKYMAVSARAFPIPRRGTLVLSADVKASTPGTVPGLVQHGVYAASGSWLDPADQPQWPAYSAHLLQAQQAALVMNVVDFCTGQVFDWFVASNAAFALIERLPTTVTGNLSNPDCTAPTEVGIDKMYTQVIREVPVSPGAWHHLDIALTRHDGDARVDYFLDRQHAAHVEQIGIPLDVQGVPFTGTYPSLGDGERLADQLESVRLGHGLFSMLDAFPFQHPGAPELSVSIPALAAPTEHAAGRARLYGQGASGAFDNFTTFTMSGSDEPARASEIMSALAAAGG
jgi:Family of unknown function (DUF6081)